MKKIRIHESNKYKKQGDLFGLFFEDINHAADGGLYAELVQNRSFEFDPVDRGEYHSLTAWEKSEDMNWEVRTEQPLHEENPHYLHVSGENGSYICNRGFNTGIYVEEGKKYDFSVFARNCGETPVSFLVSVVEEEENGSLGSGDDRKAGMSDLFAVCAKSEQSLWITSFGWTKQEFVLTALKTAEKGRLQLTMLSDGSCDLDMVSLFPQDTFLQKKGGLRRDIAEALAEMKPKFLRFPGGCLTHDGNLSDKARNSMYRWRRTLGPVENRPSWRNNWGYNQTLGLGYYEYFCFCEEIGAKPLPVVPAGFNPHKGEGVPLEELSCWVQETLDLVEFAKGDVTTTYGAIRARMGHPEPFGLEYLGIGNEEIGEGFFERYPYFHNALREKYPEIKIINTAGPFAVGEGYDAGWESAKRYGSDLVDEHYYSSPEWFLGNMHHYEDYDENGPKVFLGEYASWGNTYYNAIVEAAYMTHLERSKAVALACYAPMLCNVDYVNWRPDMLWFDNHRIMKTPNYHVQKMFMQNQGTEEVTFETEELDEILWLSDKNTLSGETAISGNDVEGRIWDICITEKDGTVTRLPEINLTLSNEEHLLKTVDSENYTLEFKFQRSSGRKGLKIFVGRTAAECTLWEFGGWDNWDCNIASICNHRGSTISHRIFHVENMEYHLKLEIEGRKIRTYVNGELYNNAENRMPEMEELYLSAGVEETADSSRTILKAVNLTGEEKTVQIQLEREKSRVQVTELSGHSLLEENTLDAPNTIVPVEKQLMMTGKELVYSFPAHSVTVLSFS